MRRPWGGLHEDGKPTSQLVCVLSKQYPRERASPGCSVYVVGHTPRSSLSRAERSCAAKYRNKNMQENISLRMITVVASPKVGLQKVD